MSIQEAFFSVCNNAVPAKRVYVSLYVRTPYYGGPEEGGWWGHDDTLIAYHACDTEEQADVIRENVEKLAANLSKEARKGFIEGCAAQLEWLVTMGMEASDLPEVDGEESYFVTTEENPGSLSHTGERHYS